MTSGRMRVPARIAQLHVASAFVEQSAAGAGMDAHAVQHVLLALEEAFINIANYAYAGADGEVEIACLEQTGRFVLTLTDSGPPFDALARAVPDLSAPLASRTAGGMGIHLIRAVTDEAAYARVDGKNVLRLVFKKAGADRPS